MDDEKKIKIVTYERTHEETVQVHADEAYDLKLS